MIRRGYQRNIAAFLLVALLVVSISSFIVYFLERQALATQNINQLEVIADVKSQQLHQWFQSLRMSIVQELNNEEVITDALTLLTVRLKSKPEYQQAYARLKKHWSYLDTKRLNTSILSNNGIVIFTTDPQREGTYQPLQNTTTYFTLEQIQKVIPTLYQSTLTQQPMITLAVPLSTTRGKRLGALAIDVNLGDLDRLIRQPLTSNNSSVQGLRNTQESYLVGRLSTVANTFLTVEKWPSSESPASGGLQSRVNSLGIDQALQGQGGASVYLNYQKTPVIGVYRWLPQYRLALLVEITQSEVWLGARKQARHTLLLGLLLSTVFLGVWGLLLTVVRQLFSTNA